jgi:hypothetical protein
MGTVHTKVITPTVYGILVVVNLAATITDKITVIPAIFTIQLTKAKKHIITMIILLAPVATIPTLLIGTIPTEHHTPAICKVKPFDPTSTFLALGISQPLSAILANDTLVNICPYLKRLATFAQLHSTRH